VPLPLSMSLAAIARVVLGGLVALYLWPRLVLAPDGVEGADRGVVGFVLATACVIIGGYLATVAHVFGPASVALVLLAPLALRAPRRTFAPLVGPSLPEALAVRVVDGLDALGRAPAWAAGWTRMWLARGGLRRVRLPSVPWGPALRVGVPAAAVLAGAAWLRWGFGLHHAGLLYSDSLETIAWVKLLPNGTVFASGIYPYGYYLTMGSLHALTGGLTVPFVKWFGPVVGVAMCGSVMWTTYRMSGGRLAPSLAAGILYGLLPAFMAYQAPRQAASEPQEFGDMFVLPILWLTYRAWSTGRAGYRVGAAAGLLLVASIEPIAMVNGIAAAVAGTLAAWLVHRPRRPAVTATARLVAGVALVAAAPLAIGVALGVHLLATAAHFALLTTNLPPPALTRTDAAAGAGIALCLLVRLFVRRERVDEVGSALAAAWLFILAVFLAQLPRFGVASLALATRSGELLALADALGVGMGVLGLVAALERVGRSALTGWIAAAAVAGIGALLVERQGLVPIRYYRMTSDAYVVAFERIASRFPRDSWLAVADGGYAFALNDGYNLEPQAWVHGAGLSTRWPNFSQGTGPATPLIDPYLFVFVPTGPSVPAVDSRAQAIAEHAQWQAVTRWVAAWQARYGPMPVYMRTPQLTVYWLRHPRNQHR